MNGAARSGSNRPLQAGRLVHHPDASAAQNQLFDCSRPAPPEQQLKQISTAAATVTKRRPFLTGTALAEF